MTTANKRMMDILFNYTYPWKKCGNWFCWSSSRKCLLICHANSQASTPSSLLTPRNIVTIKLSKLGLPICIHDLGLTLKVLKAKNKNGPPWVLRREVMAVLLLGVLLTDTGMVTMLLYSFFLHYIKLTEQLWTNKTMKT